MATHEADGGNGDARRERRPAAREVATEARQLLDAIERGSSELSAVLREQVRERPWVSLGTGVAVGYVLGGGLTLKLSGILMAAVGRAALANAISAAQRGAQAGR
jgi:ElaB/YqjD/DUF883 family membrane-anchored ribosome-binding protein